MENLIDRINIKLGNKAKDYLKHTPKRSYVSHKIFDNNLVGIQKNKFALKFNKPAYNKMCILEFKFHYNYFKNKYDIQPLILSCKKLKQNMSTKILAAINKCLILVILWLSQNIMIIQTNYSLEKWKIKLKALHLKNLLG